MKIEELQLERFFTHAGTLQEFPEGMTVLVGANGSGKTALGLEAVCWLLWGRTTRGTLPDGDVVGGFEARGKTYAVSRERKGRKAAALSLLATEGDGSVDMTGQTTGETQAKIEQVFGTWDRFCAERVFSARLRARFGSATNKERLELVAAILGLERHERAAQEARDELGARRNKLQNARVDLAGAQAALAEARRALEACPPVNLSVDEAAIAKAEKVSWQASADLGAVEEAARKVLGRLDLVSKEDRRAAAELRAAEARLTMAEKRVAEARAKAKNALERGGDCPVCLTPAASIDRARLQEHFAEEIRPLMADRDAARAAHALALQESKEAGGDLRLLEGEGLAARDRLEKLRGHERLSQAEVTRLRGLERAAQEVEARRRDAEAAVSAASGRVADAEIGEREAEDACAVAEVAVKVLGPRGARVRRMDGALRRLTREANSVLARMPVEGTGPLKIEVRGSRALASGKEVDEVSVRVEGAGNGEYDGASDGERVRLDVALMLGLARTAGEGEGLIVFDELFDPLDDAGLEAVVEILGEMAARRQVVVATHNPRFLALLPASSVWRVSRAPGQPSKVERA